MASTDDGFVLGRDTRKNGSEGVLSDPLHSAVIVLCVYAVCWALGMLFFLLRRDIEPIRSRGWELSTVAACYGLFFFLIDAITLETTLRGVLLPCDVFVWPIVVFIPLWIFPLFLRAWRLFYNYFAAAYLARQRGVTDARGTTFFRRFRFTRSLAFSFGLLAALCVASVVIAAGLLYSRTDGLPLTDITSSCLSDIVYLFVAQCAIGIVLICAFIAALWNVQDVIGLKFELQLTLLFLVPCFIVWAVLQFLSEPAMPFLSFHIIFIALAGQFGISNVVPVVWSFQMERAQQRIGEGRLGIWGKHELRKALGLDYTGSNTGDRERSTTDDLKSFDSTASPRSPRTLMHADVEAGTGPRKGDQERLLRAVLRNPIMLQGLEDYAVKSWCVENIIFWLDVQTFRADEDASRRAAQARRIFSTYIDAEAELQVNLDGSVAQRVRLTIETGANDVPLTVFDEAEHAVFMQILTDTFRKWQATPDFADSARHLLATVTAHASSTDLTVDDIRSKIVLQQSRLSSPRASCASSLDSDGIPLAPLPHSPMLSSSTSPALGPILS